MRHLEAVEEEMGPLNLSTTVRWDLAERAPHPSRMPPYSN